MSLSQPSGHGFGTPLAVDGGRHDAAGISGTFAAGKEARRLAVLQRVAFARNAHRSRGARFDGNEGSLAGQEAGFGGRIR